MSVKCVLPLNPTFIYIKKKTEVCMGKPNFLIFDCVPTMFVLSQCIKTIKYFPMKFSFNSSEIAWASFRENNTVNTERKAKGMQTV